MAKKRLAPSKKATYSKLPSVRPVLEGALDESSLLTAFETFGEVAEVHQETIDEPFDIANDESATFDTVQMQLDEQLQHGLDVYIAQQQQEPARQRKEANTNNYDYQSPARKRVPAHRSSVFDLPKEDDHATEKRSKKSKRLTEEENAVLSTNLQKANKKRRKTKASERELAED